MTAVKEPAIIKAHSVDKKQPGSVIDISGGSYIGDNYS